MYLEGQKTLYYSVFNCIALDIVYLEGVLPNLQSPPPMLATSARSNGTELRLREDADDADKNQDDDWREGYFLEKNDILRIFLEKNDQPNNDIGHMRQQWLTPSLPKTDGWSDLCTCAASIYDSHHS